MELKIHEPFHGKFPNMGKKVAREQARVVPPRAIVQLLSLQGGGGLIVTKLVGFSPQIIAFYGGAPIETS